MEHCVMRVLQRWQKSLELSGKLDEWSLNDDYGKLDKFLRTSNNRKLIELISNCRDLSIIPNADECRLSLAITKALNRLEQRMGNKYDVTPKSQAVGQRERYKSITKSMGKERVRRCRGERLRNLDVTLMDKKSSRLVRRIVEKRMCQEYHRQHKENFHTGGNRSRQNMRRAVSFQLYNLGQLEGAHICRDFGTHWKWKYDNVLQEWVLRKKVSYESYEEALIASKEFSEHHNELMQVYQCDHCKKYHIGHPREEAMEYIA